MNNSIFFGNEKTHCKCSHVVVYHGYLGKFTTKPCDRAYWESRFIDGKSFPVNMAARFRLANYFNVINLPSSYLNLRFGKLRNLIVAMLSLCVFVSYVHLQPSCHSDKICIRQPRHRMASGRKWRIGFLTIWCPRLCLLDFEFKRGLNMYVYIYIYICTHI